MHMACRCSGSSSPVRPVSLSGLLCANQAHHMTCPIRIFVRGPRMTLLSKCLMYHRYNPSHATTSPCKPDECAQSHQPECKIVPTQHTCMLQKRVAQEEKGMEHVTAWTMHVLFPPNSLSHPAHTARG
eukprot:408335-Amphidinium_carterae.1